MVEIVGCGSRDERLQGSGGRKEEKMVSSFVPFFSSHELEFIFSPSSSLTLSFLSLGLPRQ